MIALALGGAPCVWNDMRAAQAILGNAPHLVLACNDTGAEVGRLDAWATLHPENLPRWVEQRLRNGHEPCARVICPPAPPDVLGATSGLYMVQVALTQLECSGVVLCGVPLDLGAGHIARPGPWNDAQAQDRYRERAQRAARTIAPNTRSMSGWTRHLFGPPNDEWVSRNSGL